MKKTGYRFLCLLLVAVMLMAFAPAAMAVEGELLLGANYDERFYQNEPRVWSFTPSETGEYLLFTPSSGSLLGQIEGQTPHEQLTLQTGQAAQVYTLTAGTTYQIRIWLNPNHPGPYSDVFQLDKKQPLQSLTLNYTEITGPRDNYDTIRADLYPAYYPAEELRWTTSDSSIVSIESTEGYECYFRMNKVGTAVLTANIGSMIANCTVTVEKASGYWDDYEVWPSNQTKKEFSLTYGQGASFTYTPSQTGSYFCHDDGSLHTMVHGTSPSHILSERIVQTMEGDYRLLELVAGETYVVQVAPNYTETGGVQQGTVTIDKARNVSSITLYGPNLSDGSKIVGYVGGMMDLYAMTDPIYASALNGGYCYTSSNFAIAAPEWDTVDASNIIHLNEAGNCNITVSSGSVSVVCPVMVKPSPVLMVGKTTTLEFNTNDAYGVTCLFTPSKSGNYTFSMKGNSGTCYIEDTEIATYFYGSGAMSGWLQGGKTYEVVLGVGNSDHTVTVYGAGSVPPDVENTDPPMGGDQETPSLPLNPSNPDDPTVPSDPADPLDPSTPTTPSDPDVPSQPEKPEVQPKPEMEELADQLNGRYIEGNIRIPAQDENLDITSELLEQMAEAETGLVIVGEAYELELNSTALGAIAQQGSGKWRLHVQADQQVDFTAPQQDALKNKIISGVISINLTCGSTQIHNFGGGQASVTVPFTPTDNAEEYAVYYLSPEGSLEKVASTYADGAITFRTGHFSDYVIIHDAVKVKQPNLLFPILIGVAVLAAAAVVTVVLIKKKK